MLLVVNLIHLRKQTLLYWKKLHKISHVLSNTTSLEVNENFTQIKTKLSKNTLLELNLTCIAMKLELA